MIKIVFPPGWTNPSTRITSPVSGTTLGTFVSLTNNFGKYYQYDGIMRREGVPVSTFASRLLEKAFTARPRAYLQLSGFIDVNGTIKLNPSRLTGSTEDLSPLSFYLFTETGDYVHNNRATISAITSVVQYANGNVYAETQSVTDYYFHATEGVFFTSPPSTAGVRSPYVPLNAATPTPERAGISFYFPSWRISIDGAVVHAYWARGSVPKTVWECSVPVATKIEIDAGGVRATTSTLKATLEAGTGEE